MSLAKVMYDLLPSIYRSEDAKIGEPLRRFLEVLSEGTLDPIHDKILEMPNLLDIDKAPDEYLDYLAALTSYEFPFDLSPAQKRRWIKNANSIYERKGTKSGLIYLVNYLTGWEADIVNEDPVLRHYNIRIEAEEDLGNIFYRKEDQLKRIIQLYAPIDTSYTVVMSYLFSDQFSSNFQEIEMKDHIQETSEETFNTSLFLDENFDKIKFGASEEEFSLIQDEEAGGVLSSPYYRLSDNFSLSSPGGFSKITDSFGKSWIHWD